jgi:hypothetical protein
MSRARSLSVNTAHQPVQSAKALLKEVRARQGSREGKEGRGLTGQFGLVNFFHSSFSGEYR